MVNYKCPTCGSEQVQRVSVVYESGTTSTRGRGLGVAIAGDDLIPVGTSTRSTSQTQLAARLVPPKKQGAGYILSAVAITLGGVVFGLIPAAAGGVIGIAIGSCLALGGFAGGLVYAATESKKVSAYNSQVWEKQYQQWQRRWLCHKCGHVFTPEVTTSDAASWNRP